MDTIMPRCELTSNTTLGYVIKSELNGTLQCWSHCGWFYCAQNWQSLSDKWCSLFCLGLEFDIEWADEAVQRTVDLWQTVYLDRGTVRFIHFDRADYNLAETNLHITTTNKLDYSGHFVCVALAMGYGNDTREVRLGLATPPCKCKLELSWWNRFQNRVRLLPNSNESNCWPAVLSIDLIRQRTNFHL